jgi:hypothetical protein
MKLYASKSLDVQEKILLKRNMDELNRKRCIRQKIIQKDLTDGVAYAIRTAKNRSGYEHREPHEVVQIQHWKPQSVMRIMDYCKLNETERISAIQDDVEFFHSTVQRLQDHYREWRIEPRYADKAKTLPNQILVSRK